MTKPRNNFSALKNSFFTRRTARIEKGINNNGYLMAMLMPNMIPEKRYLFLIRNSNPAREKIVAGKSLIIVLVYSTIDGWNSKSNE